MNIDSFDLKAGPIAQAADIISMPWNPLIIRELICGCRRFNEIHKNIPRISRALLAKRMRHLESAGIVEKTGAKGTEYKLTESGMELAPIISEMSRWGQKKIEHLYQPDDWQVHCTMYAIGALAAASFRYIQSCVISVEISGASGLVRNWWFVVRPQGVELCNIDRGLAVDLHLVLDFKTVKSVWSRELNLWAAIERDRIFYSGNRDIVNLVSHWLERLKLSGLLDELVLRF
ncbi:MULTISPECIES: winged helix-turn-helix transcriptional regulator [Kordiimonas]|jgi:DNA-binding HxlR family transcriptional regulator|uniref:winged helix-turn-helix transcriptional regulator n=1 Tax=Kordiimonas TaxID=288021 RepID=UPI0025802DC4|nr:helix-turn-helix domain-containing protein [Kordiimonas sp. UBA4487]